jgi:microsomal dipeptidase-like Zn-dependent dipeptidase
VARTTECIAIGSDLEGFIHPVSGLEHVARIRDLEAALLRDRSFTSEQVEGILWKNAFRTLSLGWG